MTQGREWVCACGHAVGSHRRIIIVDSGDRRTVDAGPCWAVDRGTTRLLLCGCPEFAPPITEDALGSDRLHTLQDERGTA